MDKSDNLASRTPAAEGATISTRKTPRSKAPRAADADAATNGAVVDEATLRELLAALRASSAGDFAFRLEERQSGLAGELAKAYNDLADRRATLADELQRVARVVREGRLNERMTLPRYRGAWRETTEAVNGMIDDLVRPTNEIARVIDAVAEGDLSKTMELKIDGRPLRGEFRRIGTTVNAMVDQLSSFADEVTRVAREVGTEGKLGGQAKVKGTSGVWKDLTDNVNLMASNLTAQVRDIAQVTTAVAQGDLSHKITVDVKGEILELKNTINTMVDQLSSFADEVTRVAREVGTEGKLGGQARVKGVSGTWKDLTDNVNFMATNLTTQVRGIARVVTAVANGDLDDKFTIEAQGEVAELADTINSMIDTLRAFAGEVTRVAREVGNEGILGGQADVKGVSGVWKDLTDNVNTLADNLTGQVRNIAEVTTAVAEGDLSRKITVTARGEILELKETVNTMVDQLRSFAAEVTRVAKEVGTEGVLGGQAQVKDVSGVWRDLTENVNTMAASLTTQVRAIADVSTAVTQGDLTRSVAVEAKGEVADLKDNINAMIHNLAETTRRNAEQDWLNSNLARFTGMMQGQRDLETVSRTIMSELTPLVGAHHGAFFLAHHGAFFLAHGEGEELELRLISSYAYKRRKSVANRFTLGEGLVGQAALEKSPILLTQAPDDYIRITSGLGEAAPHNIFVLPALFEGQPMAVVELASFHPFSETHQAFLEQLMESLGIVINVIQQNTRTEDLLVQSQGLTEELQHRSEELQTQQEELKRSNTELEMQAASLKTSEELLQQQQEELQQTNEELEEKAQLLEEQNARIEIKNREIEDARSAIEDKAEQLALSSKYKSEFLANMSHELRTPLNSMLILARLFSENPEKNLTDKQVEFAHTIYTAGSDLLTLINDILDLSKVEAGKMDVHVTDLELTEVRNYVIRTFGPVAQVKGLEFTVEIDAVNLPGTISTDEQRLQQVLKNLISNACKFTESGSVSLRVSRAGEGIPLQERSLREAQTVIAFAVEDTGVGIPADKVKLIFEAFQQADGTTSRRYGGTGLGLSISREIARLLGGEIHVRSTPGEGSTFTLYLPMTFDPALAEPSAGPPTRAPVSQEAPVLDLDPALLLRQVDDDRGSIDVDDRVVLIVEDDETFAYTVLEVARERGFKGIVALRGDAGLALAHEYKPDAIVLDMALPGMDGWAVLDHLKRHPETRHIPVHVVTGGENGKRNALRAGAVAFLEKPVEKSRLDDAFAQISIFLDRRVRNLLVVDDDSTQRQAVIELLGDGEDIHVTAVGSSEEALAELEQREYDCMVLDLKLPDMQGYQLLERVKTDTRFTDLPVIIYTGKQLTRKEDTALRRYAETIIVKDVNSPERLLDETTLFLHRVESRLPEEKRRLLQQLHSADAVFDGRKVLIVDDDTRNVFALTSALEARRMDVRYAENGLDALKLLEDDREVDVVLMDIMMPGLDGYETIRRIRAMQGFETLPIISLTAKAMKGDREKSIAAGASDYITKPVDTDKLVSLLRVWLYDRSAVKV